MQKRKIPCTLKLIGLFVLFLFYRWHQQINLQLTAWQSPQVAQMLRYVEFNKKKHFHNILLVVPEPPNLLTKWYFYASDTSRSLYWCKIGGKRFKKMARVGVWHMKIRDKCMAARLVWTVCYTFVSYFRFVKCLPFRMCLRPAFVKLGCVTNFDNFALSCDGVHFFGWWN